MHLIKLGKYTINLNNVRYINWRSRFHVTGNEYLESVNIYLDGSGSMDDMDYISLDKSKDAELIAKFRSYMETITLDIGLMGTELG